jgi:hypothetical protein
MWRNTLREPGAGQQKGEKMTKIVEISYWEVLEGREADVAKAGDGFKAFVDKHLDAQFTWGYVQTGDYVGYCFVMMTWNSGAAYGKWQDDFATHPEYQKWVDSFVNQEEGQPDYMVNREIIHLVS